MEPVLLARSEIDPKLWDECIDHSCQQVVYAFSWYLDVVCEEWTALVWPSVDDFQIVMPLPIRKKWGFKFIQQPYFCQYLGIFSRKELTIDEIERFMTQFSFHFPFISSYCFHPENYDLVNRSRKKFNELNYAVQQTIWLSPWKLDGKVQGGYSRDRQLNLKRGVLFNWAVTRQEKIGPLIDLFKVHHAGSIRNGVNPKAYILLEKLFNELLGRDMAELYYASKDGTIHAGALVVQSGSSSIYLFNAADKTGQKGNARTFLLNNYFETYRETTFDFESPQVDSIASFYQSFGGEIKPFILVTKNRLPLPLRQIQILRKWFFTAIQGLF